jgi:hypothetical protein
MLGVFYPPPPGSDGLAMYVCTYVEGAFILKASESCWLESLLPVYTLWQNFSKYCPKTKRHFCRLNQQKSASNKQIVLPR